LGGDLKGERMATITPDRAQPEPHAFELPSHYLPAVESRDLPEPVPFRKVVGASVIILATAIGSGEFVLWPYITSQVGLVFIWAAVVGFLIQFFINMEVERYTLATGETALTGFARLWKPWGVLFIVFALCQNFWPGWATGAATTLTFAVGGGDVVTITVLALVAIGLALTASPVVYQTAEKAMGVMVFAIMVFVVIAVVMATDGGAWGDFATSFTEPEIPVGGDLTIALLLGALAFAGAGGANNLVQSNYIRDKNMGMGQRIPHIVSPITGEEEAEAPFGYTFRVDDENMRRWRGWWSVANKEQFITFFLIGVTSLIVLSVLTYSTVPVGADLGEEFAFIEHEGTALKDEIAPWFGTAFWICGAICLFSTNLGILDYTSRLIADQLKVSMMRESTFWSESKIYFAAVWTMIVFGCVVLLSGLEQPLLLLVISSSIAGVMMFIYSILLIQLNRRALPRQIKISGARLAVMAFSVLFFGVFSVLLVYDEGKALF
jgi:Mn2+/Fe2+ NRAMP family transporter